MNKKGSILVIDSNHCTDGGFLKLLSEAGYTAKVVSDSQKAAAALTGNTYSVILINYNLPIKNGPGLFKQLKEISPGSKVIVIYPPNSKEDAIKQHLSNCYDFLVNPLNLHKIEDVFKNAAEQCSIESRASISRDLGSNGIKYIIGKSKEFHKIIELTRKVAPCDITVLITGESGTGKEIIANLIHDLSDRRQRPLYKMNCAAIPELLQESELFGYEKGAFTGADRQKIGKFEEADNGIFFLDEIGDMSISTQTKLLRIIQENEFVRVGGVKTIKVNLRIIAATNKDLSIEVKEGRFREDLLFRLNVVSIYLPPLRERVEDIPELTDYFISKYNKKFNKAVKGVSNIVLKLLLKYKWPGNIRELENVIQRGVLLAEKDILQTKDISNTVYNGLSRLLFSHNSKLIGQSFPVVDFEGKKIEEDISLSLTEKISLVSSNIERRLILDALNREGWKRQETADLLKISRKGLHNKMKKYSLIV